MIPLKSQDDVIRDLQAMGFELFVHRTSSWKFSLVGDNGTRRDVYACETTKHACFSDASAGSLHETIICYGATSGAQDYIY